jgi:transposase
VTSPFDSLPRDLAAAHALILAERTARLKSEGRAARAAADLIHAQATASRADALTARLTLEIEKLRRTLYGARSAREERLIDQLEMQLEDAGRRDRGRVGCGTLGALDLGQIRRT